MQQYAAIAIAALFALAALVPLARGSLRRPLLWLCLAAGALVHPIAREGMQIGWDWVRPMAGLADGPAGSVAYLLIAAAVGELVKVTVPLLAIVTTPADSVTGLAYGAAAGAGFGFMATQHVLRMALGLVGSPFITAASTAVAVVGWFFTLLAHAATTGYLARAGVRGGFGLAYLFVWAVQAVLGLAQRLPVIAGIPTGLLVSTVVSLWLFGHLLGIRARAAASPVVGT